MTKQELIDLTKQVYLSLGKVKKINPDDLKDSRYSDFLHKSKSALGEAALHLEAIAQMEVRENPEEFIAFQEEIFQLKKTEVYN